MEKDDVIGKSLEFQNAFDTIFLFYSNFAPVMREAQWQRQDMEQNLA